MILGINPNIFKIRDESREIMFRISLNFTHDRKICKVKNLSTIPFNNVISFFNFSIIIESTPIRDGTCLIIIVGIISTLLEYYLQITFEVLLHYQLLYNNHNSYT